MTFKDLEIIPPILSALSEQGYTHPTPIQEQSIPILLQGKDLLGCAQTGTGKTAAFAVPIIQNLMTSNKGGRGRNISALVVTPTRELAIQIDDNFTKYAKFTPLRNTVIFGGVKQASQVKALKSGVDILVATPGRLLDLIQQGYISLNQIEYFVLDEADQMLDMGFIHDIKKIIAKLPTKRQSLFFSATMATSIVNLSKKILGNPERVTIAPEQTTAEKVEQCVYFVPKKNKIILLKHLLEENDIPSALVFSRTKHGANKIVKLLNRYNIHAEAIHGNKSQNARQKALESFKAGDTKVLVATDIAARGIDVDSLSHVINYDLPNVPETYVHRIGRTGRAGASGMAYSFCDSEERAYLRDIQRLIGQTIPSIKDHPFSVAIEDTEGDKESQESQRPPRNRPNNNNNRRRSNSNGNANSNGNKHQTSNRSRSSRHTR